MNLTTDKFNELISYKAQSHALISIYLPTSRTGQVPEDRIRFKNVLAEAEDKLLEGKVFLQKRLNEKAIRQILAPAYELLEKEEFWLHLSDGLVLFISKGFLEYFILPIKFKPFVYIGRTFYVRHLFPLVANEDRFFLLALSQGEVRFFEGHNHHITPVIIEDLVPENIDKVLTEQESTLQAHSGRQGNAIFHGQGAGKDQKNIDLEKYFRQVDNGLMKMLHDEDAPLIIAAVDYLVPIYKGLSRYSNIVDAHISGNPENDDAVLLHEKAMYIMRKIHQQDRQQKKSGFAYFLAEGKASLSFLHIVTAAKEGKIDTLFVDKDTPVVWGDQESTGYPVKLEKEQNYYNTCLLNYAAIEVWRNGGTVYNISRSAFPNIASYANAIFRY